MYLFIRFLSDLNEGVYVQLTMESVLLNQDGKQLLVIIISTLQYSMYMCLHVCIILLYYVHMVLHI